MRLFTLAVASLLSFNKYVQATPTNAPESNCRKTSVAILGAGVAGITAAQALSNASISDFLIVEYKDHIGGRVTNRAFGQRSDGSGPYYVEQGANWVQGLGSPGGPENPIWTLAKKYNLVNTYSNFSSIQTFNETGAVEYGELMEEFEEGYAEFEQDAGEILKMNLQDRSARAGLSVGGWKPRKSPKKQVLEWFAMDFEYANPPEETSHQFAVVNYNTSFYLWSEENNFVHDARGFAAFIKGEAATFLHQPSDPRLLLNTVVKNISYSPQGVHIYNHDDSCIHADYALCTFSLGVLQQEVVAFEPPIPSWKRTAIESMTMGTYTKIFLQFKPEDVFWDRDTQFFLYADPVERGYYPAFQSLDGPGFEPGSGILFVTVVDHQSYVVEAQDDDTTKAQVMQVLRRMYGPDISEPVDFYYPRWSLEPWAFGSYSNWPPSLTLEMHQNLRANLDRLWFAGEATHPQYFGFLQGAWYEGKQAAEDIAECVKNNGRCEREKNYPLLKGTTGFDEYSEVNGWSADSFATFGLGE